MIIIILKAGSFLKLLEVLILSGVKFLLAPPYAIGVGFNYIQTFLITTIGGLMGVVFFFYVSEFILKMFKKVWPVIKNYFSKPKLQSENLIIEIEPGENRKKQFTRKNRFLVLTVRKYGLWGIAILTPILLSIPLGTFLASKYYKNKKSVLLSLAVSVVGWSLVMSSIYAIFKLKAF
jgi:hypothetical protein